MNKALIVIVLIVLFGVIGFFFIKNRQGMSQERVVTTEKLALTSSAAAEKPQQISVAGTPLVTQNGMTLISVESLQTEKAKLFEANPQLKKLSAYMGEKELDRNLLQGLTSQLVMEQYIKQNKIDQSTAYKTDLQSALKVVERMIK